MRPPSIAIMIIIVAHLALASKAAAQARVTLVPSISVGTVYDNNLFSLPTAAGDWMNLATPSVEADWESPRISLLSLTSIDMQRAVGYSTLNSFDARRHAFLGTTFRLWSRVRFGFDGHYDKSNTPGEL